jgi:hypothetical protein
MTKLLVVVLDRQLARWFRKSERCFAARIADRTPGSKPLLEHAKQHRNLAIHVVIDADFTLAGVVSVKPAAVLDQRSLPRDGQRKEQESSTYSGAAVLASSHCVKTTH